MSTNGRPVPELTQKDRVRFWAKVRFTDDRDGCWEWQASRMARGYGHFRISRTQIHVAHRIAYSLFKGLIPQGLTVSHLCHNPPCVRPKHLIAETQQANVGRSIAGVDSVYAKLSEDDVREIRRLYSEGGITQQEISERYVVARTAVTRIINRTRWAHLA